MLFFYNSECVLFIPDCHMNITVYFFHNSRWVLFSPEGDRAITVNFFTTLDGCCLFLIFRVCAWGGEPGG